MLPRSYTRAMAKRAAADLLAQGAVACADPDRLQRILDGALWDELTIEARLREEARGLIAAHRSSAGAEGVEVDTLQEKIVAKLAHDRGLVLR